VEWCAGERAGESRREQERAGESRREQERAGERKRGWGVGCVHAWTVGGWPRSKSSGIGTSVASWVSSPVQQCMCWTLESRRRGDVLCRCRGEVKVLCSCNNSTACLWVWGRRGGVQQQPGERGGAWKSGSAPQMPSARPRKPCNLGNKPHGVLPPTCHIVALEGNDQHWGKAGKAAAPGGCALAAYCCREVVVQHLQQQHSSSSSSRGKVSIKARSNCSSTG
jgi:hypothetical protein